MKPGEIVYVAGQVVMIQLDSDDNPNNKQINYNGNRYGSLKHPIKFENVASISTNGNPSQAQVPGTGTATGTKTGTSKTNPSYSINITDDEEYNSCFDIPSGFNGDNRRYGHYACVLVLLILFDLTTI